MLLLLYLLNTFFSLDYLKLEEGEHPVSTIATNIADNQESTLVIATKQGMIKRLKLNML